MKPILKLIVVFIILILIFVLYCVRITQFKSIENEKKLSQAGEVALEYLKTKYDEEMCLTGGGGRDKDVEIYYLVGYPKSNPEIEFYIIYDKRTNEIRDGFLLSYTQYRGRQKIRQEIGDKIDLNYDVVIDTGQSEDSLKKLEDYYIKNRKYMDWYKEEEVESIRFYIYTYKLINGNEADITEFIKAVEGLDFIPSYIEFRIRRLKDSEEYNSIKYVYKDGAFILEE